MSYPIRLVNDYAPKRKKRRKKNQKVKQVSGIQIIDDDIEIPPVEDIENNIIGNKRNNKRNEDKSQSPPRKKQKINKIDTLHNNDLSPPRKRYDSDDNSDQSPPRKRYDSDDDNDLSPPRKRYDSDDDNDLSPPRKRYDSDDNSDQSPPRKHHNDSDNDLSPPRKRIDNDNLADSMKIKKRKGIIPKKPKIINTIDIEKEKQLWAKGSKQIQQELEKRMKYLEDIQKPFTRTIEDRDKENDLKSQDRFGDPMAHYFKDKKKKKTSKPKYNGPPPPPNRFNIPPGFRWDGVDRSNGFEKFWFETQAKRKIEKEEHYKWSTEDL